MVRVARHPQGAAISDLNQQAAGIGTVVRADGTNDVLVHGHFPSRRVIKGSILDFGAFSDNK
jgi:hypothetical protein